MIIKEISLKKNYLVISKNESIKNIIEKNLDENFIDVWIYKKFLKFLLFNEIKIYYGKFDFKEDKNFINLIKTITKVSNYLEKITIVECWTKIELKKILSKNFNIFIVPEYSEIIADTYFFNYGSKYSQLNKKLEDVIHITEKKYKNSKLLKKYSFKEILIIGSLLEKEGIDYQDKKKIFSVIINRLNKGMKLQIDATVIFSLTEGKFKLKRSINYKDLKLKHDYNTYYIYGLPPKPISYVGLKTIELIFENYKSEYLFYFYDKYENEHIYSINYENHLKKLNEYRSKK